MVISSILSAVPLDAQIVFVGDEDQLPSVGPGQVFKDLIDSKRIPRVNLTEVYRQQDGSSIVDLAHRMKVGEPIDITQRFHDRSFINCTSDQIPDVVDKVVKSAVSKGYNMSDIQVLAPMYKGNAGIKRLNQVLQSILNPKEKIVVKLNSEMLYFVKEIKYFSWSIDLMTIYLMVILV